MVACALVIMITSQEKLRGNKYGNFIPFEDISWKLHITLSFHWSKFIYKATTNERKNQFWAGQQGSQLKFGVLINKKMRGIDI